MPVQFRDTWIHSRVGKRHGAKSLDLGRVRPACGVYTQIAGLVRCGDTLVGQCYRHNPVEYGDWRIAEPYHRA